MISKRIQACLIGVLAAAVLPAYAAPNVCSDSRLVYSGIGGTGSPLAIAKGSAGATVSEGGIGGTGMPLRGGIGGTGSLAEGGIGGTGIVGVVTGFGSICVDGLEVHYSSNTPVDVDGNMSSVNKLLLGQVVAVRASGEENNLHAGSISVVHALNGQVANLNAQRGTLDVLGVTVKAAPEILSSIKPGDTVKVSGLWMNDGSLAALRVDPSYVDTASVIGTFRHPTDGRASVNGIELILPERAATPAEGSEVRVSGVWEGQRLRATNFAESPVNRVLKHASDFYIQGFATPSADGQFSLGGRVVRYEGQAGLVRHNGLAVVRGRVDEQGGLVAKDIATHDATPSHDEFGPGNGMDYRGSPGNGNGQGGDRGKNSGGGFGGEGTNPGSISPGGPASGGGSMPGGGPGAPMGGLPGGSGRR